ncbi:MAG: vWA domain-containing protein [Promethearchaeota archaeon]
MTKIAAEEDNIEALMSMAQSNVHAVTAELQKTEYTHFFSEKYRDKASFIPQLYFMIRSHAPLSFKLMLQRLTRSIILRSSLNISGRGSKGKSRHRIHYYPGIPEFDLEQTLFNYIQNGKRILRYGDIVGYERRQRKRDVVLMLDTSGSMFGKLLLNAAMTTSVLSYAMAKDFTSIVLFNSESYVLKSLRDERELPKLIDQILESEAVGFTNINGALKKGLKELEQKRGNRRKIGILITDGEFNRGKHPAIIARQYPRLHVINMPPEHKREAQTRGKRVCQEIATAGHGYFIPVNEFSEIPRALMNLLAKI